MGNRPIVALLAWLLSTAPAAAAQPGVRPPLDSAALRHSIGQLRATVGYWNVTTQFLKDDGSVARTAEGTYAFDWVVPDRVVRGTSAIPAMNQIAGILFYVSPASRQIVMLSVGGDGMLWTMSGPLGGETRTTQEFKTATGAAQLRFTRYNVTDDAFESRMEYTEDGGKTWKPGNHQTFKRGPPPVPPEQTDGYVTAGNGLRLYYSKYGDGPEVVLAPGGFLIETAFRPIANPRRTVVFYDMRNRGRSDPVPDSSQISLEADIADLEAVRAFIGAERVSLIGYSYLGKMVALYAAAHPDRVERIAQIGPVPPAFDARYPDSLTTPGVDAVWDTSALNAVRAMQRRGLPVSRPSEYCRAEWSVTRVGLVGSSDTAEAVSDQLCDYPNEWPINLARQFRFHLPTMERADFGPQRFALVSMPVLTVHGTRDRNAPYGSGREWASRLPNARLLTVPGGGHNAWLDAPGLVVGGVDEFLNGAWPAAAERIRR